MPRFVVSTTSRRPAKRRLYKKRQSTYRKKAEYRKKSQRPTFNRLVDYPQLKHDIMLASALPVAPGAAFTERNSTIVVPATGMQFINWSSSRSVTDKLFVCWSVGKYVVLEKRLTMVHSRFIVLVILITR